MFDIYIEDALDLAKKLFDQILEEFRLHFYKIWYLLEADNLVFIVPLQTSEKLIVGFFNIA